MEISAIFDSVDSAEWALARLRENGVQPKTYRILPADERWFSQGGDWNERIAPAMLAGGFNNGLGYTAGLGDAMGVGPAFAPWGVLATNDLSGIGADVVSREAKLIVNVQQNEAERTRHVLTSHHGRRVS